MRFTICNCLVFFLVFVSYSYSLEKFISAESMKSIPVLDNGRIKPLDTYARTLQIRLTGTHHLKNLDPIDFLTLILFTPDIADTINLFKLPDKESAYFLRVSSTKECISYCQLSNAFHTLTSDPTMSYHLQGNQNLFSIVSNLMLYTSIRSTCSNLDTNTSTPFLDKLLLFDKPIPDRNDSLRNKAAEMEQLTNNTAYSPFISGLEVAYNAVNPFLLAKLFYAFSIIFFSLHFLFKRKFYSKCALALLFSAWLIQTAGLVNRIIFLQRPPATNLYETFILVAWIAALFGILNARRNNLQVAFVTTITSLLLIHIASTFGMSIDSGGMLTAIVNSNFWLTTHVLVIATGYAGCIAASAAAHAYLIQHVFSPKDLQAHKKTYTVIYVVSLFALTATVAGTIIGGLWADIAWGRFWGWDPKENGALIIIIWYGALLHAKQIHFIHEKGFSFGAAFGAVVVMVAWVGANALGIGLHSYGFTKGGAQLLAYFTLGECLFAIAILTVFLKRIDKKQVVISPKEETCQKTSNNG